MLVEDNACSLGVQGVESWNVLEGEVCDCWVDVDNVIGGEGSMGCTEMGVGWFDRYDKSV